MVLRAWGVWGILAVLIGAIGAQAKPPESQIPVADGTATPVLTQNYYQPEPGPSPRLLPIPMIVAARIPEPKRGLPLPIAPPSHPDVPIRAMFKSRGNWEAETAFAIAEMNLEAGDIEEATRWYEEVIKQAPDSGCASGAEVRLSQTKSRSK